MLDEKEVCRSHAARDHNQGREWNCPCPTCRLWRKDSELVAQIREGLKKSPTAAKKSATEPKA